MKDKIIKFSLVIFVLVYLSQVFIWGSITYGLDFYMWSTQLENVDTGNEAQFNFDHAYAHPGGTIVLSGLAIHNIFDLSYDESLFHMMAFFLSLFITFSIVLCFLIFPESVWWVFALPIFILNRVYLVSTPPSILASVIFVSLFLFTFYLYQKKKKEENVSNSYFAIFGIMLGFLVATRIDIGIFAFIFLSFLLKEIFGFKKTIYLIFISFISFCIFNPFMWYMPITHLGDLAYKIIYHYKDYAETAFPLSALLNVSFTFVLSSFLLFFFLRKKKVFLIEENIFYTIFFMTVSLYVVFLTSAYKAERYFLPLVLVWDLFLPLFILKLLPFPKEKKPILGLKTKQKDFFYLFVLFILLFYPIFLFLVQFI